MRPIKFRVWDKITEEMFYFGDGKFSIDMEGKLFDESEETPRWVNYRCTTMQFTGLLDKNVKEIYEGDVISFIYGVGIQNTAIVRWTNELGVEAGYGPFCFESWQNRVSMETVEVIGNIYETHELLTK